ncbi:hypothetical protein LTR84_012977 [Exophiala bonariae]|uniref:C2H2-type domain-containing protein n=1 Tax=Exophiala bonariae TaxID=1690606 RepID=A0AAV9NEQ2_9EURO|nr:hypothetical protein LTR84_012977 [Exophiala bonariae]
MSKGRDHTPEQLFNLPTTSGGIHKMLATELNERYDDMLQSIPNAAQTLSWVALAVRPISSLEMETAFSWIRCTTISEPVAASKMPAQSLGLAERLSKSTGGLLRIFYSHRGSTIRLANESVRDPLLQSRMKELSVPLSEISRGRSMVHLEMARTCLQYMLSNVATVRTAQEFPSAILAQYPFLEYATSYWAAHAKAANSGSISDDEFLRYFPWPTDAEMNLVGLASSIIHLNFGTMTEKYSTFLHYAAYCGLDKPLRAVMSNRGKHEYNLDIDTRTCSGRTALHIAASMGHWSVVNYLLSRGANVHAKDTVYGNSILHWVALSPMTEGKIQSLEYLIQASADVNDTSNGMTPLALAVAYGDTTVTSALLKAGAHPDGMDRHRGLTALSLAIVHKHVNVISQLLDANACLKYGDIKTGLTPLEIAIATKQHDVVFMLLKKGAGVSLPTLAPVPQNHGAGNQYDRDRMWLNRMLLCFRDFAGSAFVERPTQPDKASAACSNQNIKPTHHPSSINSRKRTNRDESDQQEEEDDDDEDHSKRPRRSTNLPEDKADDDAERLCPYYLRDKRKHRACRKSTFKKGRLHHVLEHLKRVHYKSICMRCKRIFPNDTELKEHSQQKEPCPLNMTRNYEDGYDLEQHNLLHARKRGSEEKLGSDGFWNRICHILFKDYDEIKEGLNNSGAADISENLQGFENFIRQDILHNSSLRQSIREVIGRTDEVAETTILKAFRDLPDSFSERYLQRRNAVPASASSGLSLPQPRLLEHVSTQSMTHADPSSDGERHSDTYVSQSSLDTPRCGYRQLPVHSISSRGHHGPPLSIESYPPRPSLPINQANPVYPILAQSQTPFYNPNLPQQQSLPYSPWSYQPQPGYTTVQPFLPDNTMTYHNPWSGYYPVMENGFSSSNQQTNPIPFDMYGSSNSHGPIMNSIGQGGTNTLHAIRNQNTSTQSSYAVSNMASDLGMSHTSATSQYQPAASDSSALDILQRNLDNAGLSELGPFDPGEPPNSASSPFRLDEEGDQEDVASYSPEQYTGHGGVSNTPRY